MNGRDSYIRCVFMLAEGMGCRLHECLRLLGRRALPDSNDDEIERDTCDLKALTRAVDVSANLTHSIKKKMLTTSATP